MSDLSMQTKIILSTLNAKYVHAALGLRYLYANLQELRSQSEILEFSINGLENDIAEHILSKNPLIVGFGVYIWNITQTLQLIRLLKTINPHLIIILGGPEVSYETEQQEIVQWADYVITGQGDLEFYQLCSRLLDGVIPKQKLFQGVVKNLDELILPYDFYSEEDIKHRLIYVEASRGCPFKCEFCLSALDKTSYPFNLDNFIAAIERLHRRGARRFKFVDRTFNLKVEDSLRILEFFLQRLDKELFLHFEIIPDRLPQALKKAIQQFPQGALQFEIGVQSFNVEVQSLISRKQDNPSSMDNLRWLRQESAAHLHTDLIFGLPGEDLASFAAGFDRLYELQPHDIQVGILKRLRGTPIIRHSQNFHLKFNPNPPYEVLSTNCIDYQQVRQLSRFARYWEIIGNSQNFKHSLKLLLDKQPFWNFYHFSQWLYEYTGQTHKFSLRRLYDLIYLGGQHLGVSRNRLWESLWADYQVAGLKGKPEFMKYS